MKPTDFWYPRKPAKYRAKTRHLTERQDLYYQRLIDDYMETGKALPNDRITLASICRTTPEIWDENSEVLLKFFTVEKDGLLHQETCDELLDEQNTLSNKRKRAASKAAKKRWSKDPEIKEKNAQRIPNAMRKHATGQDRTGHHRTGDDDSVQSPNSVQENKISSLPARDAGDGDLNFSGKDLEIAKFDIEHQMTDDDWMEARLHCKGKDVHYLARLYNETINSGRKARPRFPSKAFIGWIKNYLKDSNN